ncbi:MAG: PilZ domain-containing protein [Vicinamibacterales bacterium]
MASDVSILIADANRMAAIRDGIHLPGTTVHFTPGGLGSAMENIRTYRPRIVAIDAIFGQTPTGVAFMDRVDALGIAGSVIKLIVQHDGKWVTASRGGVVTAAVSADLPLALMPEPPSVVVPTPQIVAAAPNVDAEAEAAAPAAPASTRRAPRFLVQGSLDAALDIGRAKIVDLSVLGAQLVSIPLLRPNQRIMLSLADNGRPLSLVAQVAWSAFERPSRGVEPYYRAGIEFSGSTREALEDYRTRHCAGQPIPCRDH